MKQVLQSLRNGETRVESVPCPVTRPGQLLIATSRTLVSAGTERMLVDFGKAGLISKAKQQPDKVSMVLQKIRADGLLPTIETVMNKLDQPLPMGYCNVGVVTEVGAGVAGLAVGDRVASNGKHAEMVSVPRNLCVRVPETVSDEEASFTVLGAIALQGIRLVKPSLGECVVVIGLGLIGLMAVQLLRANGCRVLGLDFDATRLALAREYGAETTDLSTGADALAAAEQFSRGRGVDAVIVTAATKSNEPIQQAARMCRKRGRIVLVGVSGLELSRDDFYEKELTLQVSCSYGPGRYDPTYEEQGVDYPVGYVRWTEQRNFEAVLDMMASGQLDVAGLISHRFSIAEASSAYEVVSGSEPSLGILLEYSSGIDSRMSRSVVIGESKRDNQRSSDQSGGLRIAFIGAGNYAQAALIPAFKRSGAMLHSVASLGGSSSVNAARKFGFAKATTDIESLFINAEIDAVVIATRHDSHAQLVCDALRAGKHVFVEKPLALNIDELDAIKSVLDEVDDSSLRPKLMVGFNRRFAPHVQSVCRSLRNSDGPISVLYTVNAGAIDSGHWTQIASSGGGRIIGECCHFIDLVRFLVGREILDFSVIRMADKTADTVSIGLTFVDGSISCINYFANGDRSFPKERVEVFSNQRVARLDNFRKLESFRWPGLASNKLWRQDKGQQRAAKAFVESISSGSKAPIPQEELLEVSRRTIEIAKAASA